MKVQRNSIKVSADKVSALHLIVDFRGCRKERRRVEKKQKDIFRLLAFV